MDSKSVEKALAGLEIGPLRYFDCTGSTNDEAARWVEEGAPDLALVVADEQTAGRGRLDRRWFTPPGAALAFSLVLKEGRSGGISRLTALGALAVCSALQEMYKREAQIKWPNDVLLQGRKTAGVLVEAHWQGEKLATTILGIGVNVNPESLPPVNEQLYPATCVETVLGRPVDRLELLRAILAQLILWRKRLSSQDFLQVWEQRLAFRGEWVHIASEAGEKPGPWMEGEVLGLNEDGSLKLRDRSGVLYTLHIGEVRLRPLDREPG